MARVGLIALLALPASLPAAAQSAASDNWRIHKVDIVAVPAWQLPGTGVGASGRFGIGMFGLRSRAVAQRPVTVREVDAPRQRRAGVGFLLKF